jgi:hypothetical protein
MGLFWNGINAYRNAYRRAIPSKSRSYAHQSLAKKCSPGVAVHLEESPMRPTANLLKEVHNASAKTTIES